MKLDLVRELDVLRSAQNQDYARSTAELKSSFETALLSQQKHAIKEMSENAEELKNLKYSMEQSLEIFKLYMAVSIASSVAISDKYGVPRELTEHCKQRYFIKIASSKSRQELIKIMENANKEILKYFEEYFMEKYSHSIKMAIEYIHNNKFLFIYAKDVAKAVGMNRSYFSKKFKEEVGTTITDYIHHVKIDMATKLMESHMYKLHEIAEMLGYSNYTYFAQVFKKHKGISPREY